MLITKIPFRPPPLLLVDVQQCDLDIFSLDRFSLHYICGERAGAGVIVPSPNSLFYATYDTQMKMKHGIFWGPFSFGDAGSFAPFV